LLLTNRTCPRETNNGSIGVSTALEIVSFFLVEDRTLPTQPNTTTAGECVDTHGRRD